ncbi:MAG: DUF3127 domain-containing protein [Saprospiraceae bacterium]|jgi:hypothetical protein|nr:DUF3127 domain-containing protein [Saprospiraceae bacterium]
MQLTRKLIQILPIQTGTGKNSEWKKQDIILETQVHYPKKMCVSIWCDKINASHFQLRNMLKIDFDIDSREYNVNWFTDIKSWRVDIANASVPCSSEYPDNIKQVNIGNEDEVLPF